MSRGGRLHRLGLVGLALMACGTADSATSAASVDSAEVCNIVTWQDYVEQYYPYACQRWERCDPESFAKYASIEACVEFQTDLSADSPQTYSYWGCGPFDPDKGCTQLACAKTAVVDCDESCLVGTGYLMEPTCSPSYD